MLTPDLLKRLRALDELAKERGQTLAQMSLAWLLHQPGVTSALVGASRPEQLLDSLGTIQKLDFEKDELEKIESITNC